MEDDAEEWVSLNNLQAPSESRGAQKQQFRGRAAEPQAGDVGGDGAVAPVSSGKVPGHAHDRVVQVLLRKEIVTMAQVEAAAELRRKKGLREPLWRVLAGTSEVDRAAVFKQAAITYAFRVGPVEDRPPSADFVKSTLSSYSEELRDQLMALNAAPYAYAQDQGSGLIKLVFITDDPMRPELQRVMHALELERFELCYAPRTLVRDVLDKAYPRKNEYLERLRDEGDQAYDLGASFESGENKLVDEEALEAEISRSSLINLVEALLVESVRMGASDIHVYPNADRQTVILFRVDGRLQHWHTEEKGHPEALLAVLKDNAINVDRFERDTAQDGFIQRWVDDTLIRYRVSVLPIANANPDVRGESIVIRVLDDRKVLTDLAKLGLLPGALEQFNKAIRQPNGMVILTGPTGSGKSTTLVAALSQVVSPEVNVLTVEDPVEYMIPGVRQIQISHKLSLEGALRAILRHDPDIVMVGEMRDKDTAELGVKLANTGHLTFSTLHTNDAPSAVSRLYKMGLEPFLIANSVTLVAAQRLIRMLCPDCKEKELDPDVEGLKRAGFTADEIESAALHDAGTDSHCKTCRGHGYKGRRAISEVMPMTRALRRLIVTAEGNLDEDAIRDLAVGEGMVTLPEAAKTLVLAGETSVDEMVRVVGVLR